MPITLLDGILIVIMLISALLAMIRGFVREVLSIAAWIAAAAAAFFFYDDLLPTVQQYLPQKQLSVAASAGGIFIVTLIIVSVITMKISDFVLDSRIGALDRTLGFVFGAARGMLLVVVAMLFFNWFMPNPDMQPKWIVDAKSKPLIDAVGARLMAALPEDPEKEILDQFQNPLRDETTTETGDAPAEAPADAPAERAPTPAAGEQPPAGDAIGDAIQSNQPAPATNP